MKNLLLVLFLILLSMGVNAQRNFVGVEVQGVESYVWLAATKQVKYSSTGLSFGFQNQKIRNQFIVNYGRFSYKTDVSHSFSFYRESDYQAWSFQYGIHNAYKQKLLQFIYGLGASYEYAEIDEYSFGCFSYVDYLDFIHRLMLVPQAGMSIRVSPKFRVDLNLAAKFGHSIGDRHQTSLIHYSGLSLNAAFKYAFRD